MSHPNATFRADFANFVINRSIPTIFFFLRGVNCQFEDLPCNCGVETPCSVATPTIAVKKSQIRVSLLLLKKILALFQGDKYRALSSFQGVIPSVNNVDPLAKLLLAKMDSFPEEALDCFWSLLEELTKNEFPSFVLFESDEQRLEFVRILISHIKSNNEPLLVVALKTLRALSRNVQEMRSIRFDDLHRAELVQVLIDKLGYELRDFSPQFTGILLNVIANLSLEFAGLRLVRLWWYFISSNI